MISNMFKYPFFDVLTFLPILFETLTSLQILLSPSIQYFSLAYMVFA